MPGQPSAASPASRDEQLDELVVAEAMLDDDDDDDDGEPDDVIGGDAGADLDQAVRGCTKKAFNKYRAKMLNEIDEQTPTGALVHAVHACRGDRPSSAIVPPGEWTARLKAPMERATAEYEGRVAKCTAVLSQIIDASHAAIAKAPSSRAAVLAVAHEATDVWARANEEFFAVIAAHRRQWASTSNFWFLMNQALAMHRFVAGDLLDVLGDIRKRIKATAARARNKSIDA